MHFYKDDAALYAQGVFQLTHSQSKCITGSRLTPKRTFTPPSTPTDVNRANLLQKPREVFLLPILRPAEPMEAAFFFEKLIVVHEPATVLVVLIGHHGM